MVMCTTTTIQSAILINSPNEDGTYKIVYGLLDLCTLHAQYQEARTVRVVSAHRSVSTSNKLSYLVSFTHILDSIKSNRNMSSKRAAAKERVDFDEEETIEITTTDDVEIFTSFDSLGLKEDLLRGIYAYGIVREIKYESNC